MDRILLSLMIALPFSLNAEPLRIAEKIYSVLLHQETLVKYESHFTLSGGADEYHRFSEHKKMEAIARDQSQEKCMLRNKELEENRPQKLLYSRCTGSFADTITGRYYWHLNMDIGGHDSLPLYISGRANLITVFDIDSEETHTFKENFRTAKLKVDNPIKAGAFAERQHIELRKKCNLWVNSLKKNLGDSFIHATCDSFNASCTDGEIRPVDATDGYSFEGCGLSSSIQGKVWKKK